MTKALVTYYSKSGNTEAMGKIICAALKSAGADVVSKAAGDTDNADFKNADVIAIGSPDYFSYPAGYVKTLFDDALAIKSELASKPAICFVSHGGGGRAKEPLEALVKAIGLRLVAPCVLSHDAPAGETVEELHAAAKALLAAVKK